jgi:hypothetical protein
MNKIAKAMSILLMWNCEVVIYFVGAVWIGNQINDHYKIQFDTKFLLVPFAVLLAAFSCWRYIKYISSESFDKSQ